MATMSSHILESDFQLNKLNDFCNLKVKYVAGGVNGAMMIVS
jgi:hypothetical protein